MKKRKKALNTSIHKRIKEIRLDTEKTHVQMARVLGVTLSTYRKYEIGVHAPSPATMMTYVKEYGISLEWLMLNRGPKYFDDITKALETSEKLEKENESLTQELQETREKLKDETKKSKANKEAFVPEDAEVITNKDLVELFRYIKKNSLFKHRLMISFLQHKTDSQNPDTPKKEI